MNGDELLSRCTLRCRRSNGAVPRVIFAGALLFIALFSAVAADDESKPKNIAVVHPNLLLNKTEIEQIKRKVQEYPWTGRLERVRAKAQKDDGTIEAALAYVLTGQTNYAASVRRRLLADAREQMRHYEKIDVKAEPEWGRWTWWGGLPSGCVHSIRKKKAGDAEPPDSLPSSRWPAAVHFPMRSGEEVALSFTTREELPR